MGLLPTKGNVMIDNVNLTNLREEFKNNISYIGQEPFIIDDDIFKNITFKSNLSLAEKQKVISCLKKTYLFDELKNIRNLFNEKLGINGSKLSGGQNKN